ncbi:hypothetical protein Pelo_13525 [Pelomyxa schiedti]|nr:hypothetical protein Pelo_13525 [Pelomyxa schiedti]
MARLSMFNPENTLHFGHWSSQREQELVELFEQTCGTVKRKLSPADLHSLRQIEETGEFSDLLLWLTRTASQIKKIPFVWDSKDPQLVSGFTSRDNANEMLSCSPVGTFLLRFSWADPGELVCYLLDERDPMSDIKVTEKVLQSSWLHRLQDTQTAPAPLQQNPSTPTPAPTPTTKDTTDHTDNNSIGEFSPESIPSTPSTTTTPIFQLAPLPPQQYRLTDKTVAFRHIRRLTHHRKPLKDDTE